MEFSIKGKVFNILFVNGILDLISNWVEDINNKGDVEDIIWDTIFDVIIDALIERLVDIIVIGINVVGIDESGKDDIFVVGIVDIKVVSIGDKIVVDIFDIVGIVDIIVEYKFDNIVVGISDIIVFGIVDIIVVNIKDKVDWNRELDWKVSIGYIEEGMKESGKK